MNQNSIDYTRIEIKTYRMWILGYECELTRIFVKCDYYEGMNLTVIKINTKLKKKRLAQSFEPTSTSNYLISFPINNLFPLVTFTR